MKDGFIKVACSSIEVVVADVKKNTELIKEKIDLGEKEKVNLLVLPELCVTGYTCGDLFLSNTLLDAAKQALLSLAAYTKSKNVVTVVGLPLIFSGKLYNCAAVLHKGEILGIVPKTFIPNYGEYCEARYFSSGEDMSDSIIIANEEIPFGNDLCFSSEEIENFRFGVEICEDLWAMEMPSAELCKNGALIIANLAASSESVGKSDDRLTLVSSASKNLICGYAFANSTFTESTTDGVFSGHNIIAENGKILAENKPFTNKKGLLFTEIDVDYLAAERRRITTYPVGMNECTNISFSQKVTKTKLSRKIAVNPFVPESADELNSRAETILNIQAYGLKKRIEHTHSKSAILGISGGLDSTLALLVTVKAFDLMKKSHKEIIAVTMPGFGTTDRTYQNALKICELLGVTLKEISIRDSVLQHFNDIKHNPEDHDVTYENAQARERTQILMDVANQEGGLVVGTGDLSELALGWATYNGDHMSMYGVNAGVPKTLVRHLVKYEAERSIDELKNVLLDVLDTPVSPELLPSDDNGNIAQKTEDLVGPYQLHDFFIYYTVRRGFTLKKIFRLAQYAFSGVYTDEQIIFWLEVFARRFFNQQFKRSCLPDGPKVGSVSLSPRADWHMPSDASNSLWQEQINELKEKYL